MTWSWKGLDLSALCLCVFSLVERKKRWQMEAEERRARDADAEVPAGHQLMTDDERLQTLDRIQLSEYHDAVLMNSHTRQLHMCTCLIYPCASLAVFHSHHSPAHTDSLRSPVLRICLMALIVSVLILTKKLIFIPFLLFYWLATCWTSGMLTRSQAIARIADHTASQPTTVSSN